MATKIYGASDDLIEMEGDIRGEVSAYGTDEADHGVLIVCSDGTLLEVKYGKAKLAIWQVTLIKQGGLFRDIEQCDSEDASIYSDIVNFNQGLKWAYAATEWEKVK